jgi:NADH:ubiquinone oxidoreductase subunit 3 (subunit A)
MDILFTPPVAFFAYLAVAGLLVGFGRLLAGPRQDNPQKSSTYTGGEEPQPYNAAPGYKPFFIIALFFAVLHLGILIIATSTLTPITGAYMAGLLVALVALILG